VSANWWRRPRTVLIFVPAGPGGLRTVLEEALGHHRRLLEASLRAAFAEEASSSKRLRYTNPIACLGWMLQRAHQKAINTLGPASLFEQWWRQGAAAGPLVAAGRSGCRLFAVGRARTPPHERPSPNSSATR